jgi:hypothetical protein
MDTHTINRLDSRLQALEAALVARRDAEGAKPIMMKDPGSVDFNGGFGGGKSPGGEDSLNAQPWIRQ